MNNASDAVPANGSSVRSLFNLNNAEATKRSPIQSG
jgi:hypothetical protein